MYLFFDTETTGLPKDWNAPASQFDNWPRMVQIGWQLYNEQGTLLQSAEYIIRPEGYTIPAEAAAVHGISTQRALAEGADLATVLGAFRNVMLQADYLVAHNISFDEKIVGAEFLRKQIAPLGKKLPRVCTMTQATDYCAIPSRSPRSKYKFPNLTELHLRLFGVKFDEAHTALADVEACARCFFELRKRNVIALPTA